MRIYVDVSSIEEYLDFFDGFHNSIAPRVVRNTLNDLAFTMKGGRGKTGTIEKRAKMFDYQRSKTFIKSTTGVIKARGRSIDNMKSVAGVMKMSGKETVTERLAQQEKAGRLKRKYVPTQKARIGGNLNKKINKASKHGNLNGLIDVTNRKRKIVSLIKAHRDRKPVLIKSKRGDTFLAFPEKKQVRRFKNGKVKVPLKFLYLQTSSGYIKLNKKRRFVQFAGSDALKDTQKIMNKHVERELGKLFTSI